MEIAALTGSVFSGRQQAYIEAHIEQGPVLVAEDRITGVVGGSLGSRWYDITVMRSYFGGLRVIGG